MKLNYITALLLLKLFVIINCQNSDISSGVKTIPDVTVSTTITTNISIETSTAETNGPFNHKGCYSSEDVHGVCGEEECKSSGKNFYTLRKMDVVKKTDINGKEKEVDVFGYYHFCCGKHENIDSELEECVVNEPVLKIMQQYCIIKGAVYDLDRSSCVKTDSMDAHGECPEYDNSDFNGPFEQFKDETNQVCKTIFEVNLPFNNAINEVPFALNPKSNPLFNQVEYI